MDANSRYRKIFPVSWEQLHRDSKTLAWRLLKAGPFKGLIAVTRGGLVPSAIIARELDLRLVDTLCISSYAWQSQQDMTLIKGLDHDGEGWLVVDDLVDTGKTAKMVRKLLPKAHLAAAYVKPEGKPLVDTFISEVSQETWILFPWDSELQYVQPMVAGNK